MRGEYAHPNLRPGVLSELPPRARRIHPNQPRRGKIPGTTSACAENTLYTRRCDEPPGNYLRVRGEYRTLKTAWDEVMELPPRARRIHLSSKISGSNKGTTSACAENTGDPPPRHTRSRNYLRVRGEYLCAISFKIATQELPPRARRIPCRPRSVARRPGTTSACAENTHHCSVH